ncbi:hypothetical protein ABIA32_006640 [Streptacidiphilus sp. MAP12-20]
MQTHDTTEAAPAAKGGLVIAARKIAAARARTEQPSDVSSGRTDGND